MVIRTKYNVVYIGNAWFLGPSWGLITIYVAYNISPPGIVG